MRLALDDIKFLSTLSLRRATWEYWLGGYGTAFLSTLSLRRATPRVIMLCRNYSISIHALLAESDGAAIGHRLHNIDFYPRSPCGERRPVCQWRRSLKIFLSTLSLRRATHWQTGQSRTRQFLSTLSLRRATTCTRRPISRVLHFYPRSPCGERRCAPSANGAGPSISIHALLAESDRTQSASLSLK